MTHTHSEDTNIKQVVTFSFTTNSPLFLNRSNMWTEHYNCFSLNPFTPQTSTNFHVKPFQA